MRKLVLVVTIMMGLSTMAQKSNPEKGNRGDMGNMSPEQMATLQTKRMTLALDLTEAQQKQVQSLNVDNATRRADKMKEVRAKKENGELKKLSPDERYAMQSAMLDHQIAQKSKLKKILDKDQYTKWENMKADREGHHKGKIMQSQRKRGYGK